MKTKQISETLRFLRVLNEVKLYELAKELKISTAYLSEIETGKKNPPIMIIMKYAIYFKIHSSDIISVSEKLPKARTRRQKLKLFLNVIY